MGMNVAISSLIFAGVGLVSYRLAIVLRDRLAKAIPLGIDKLKTGPAVGIIDKLKAGPAMNIKIAELERTSKKLNAVFIDVPSQKLLRMYLFAFVVLGAIGWIASGSIIGLVAGCAVAFILPKLIVKHFEKRHKKLFEAQLVDALMILSSSLKAGLSLVQAINEVANELPAPMSQEMNLVIRENRMGVPLEEALVHLKERVKIEDLNLVTTAILVSRETGGDLTLTFSQLTSTIREKKKLHGRVESLCVQAKLQGIIMGLLPIVFAGVVYSLNPHYFDLMLKDPLGQALLCYAVVSEVIGLILIKKLSKIEV